MLRSKVNLLIRKSSRSLPTCGSKTTFNVHLNIFTRPVQARTYAKKKNKGPRNVAPWFHLPKDYRPAIPEPHDLSQDIAAALAEREEITKSAEKTDIALSIEEVRRKANIKKNMEKLLEDLATQNEDPIIRRAYEELEDEERMKKGLPALKRAPPGRLRYKHDILTKTDEPEVKRPGKKGK